MLRVLLYLLLIVGIGSGFAWLANYPGELVITVQGSRIAVSLLTAVTVVLAAFFCFLLLWWLVRYVILAPLLLKRHVQTRRKDRGDQLLATGLIAALAGDAVTARHMARQSRKLLGRNKEALLPLLESQAKLLDLDHEGAVRLFEDMRKDPQTQLLALKGLFYEAVKSGAAEAANQYAQEAVRINARLQWANDAVTERLAAEGKWEHALVLFEKYAKSQSGDAAAGEKLLQRRVVLLTGQAKELAEHHPDEARRIALKAHKLQPSFVPAANVAADILFRLHEIRKGSKLVEALWKETPHPDLGLTYVNAGGQGGSAAERLKRARQLARLNPENRESQMLLARTAFEAGELAFARKTAMAVVKTAPTENTFLLLADIESAQTGDQGKIRNWLAKALQAEPDRAWIADGISLPEWSPFSPVTGHIGACEWKAPAGRHPSVFYKRKSVAAADLHPAEGKSGVLVIDVAADPSTDDSSTQETPPHDRKNINPYTKNDRAGSGETTTGGDGQSAFDGDDEATGSPTRIVVDDPGVSADETDEQDTENKSFVLK